MRARGQRRQRWREMTTGGGSVNLISMMDILTVLLLFLLKSYVAGGEVMVPPAGIHLPNSTAEQTPQSSLVVAINNDEIVVGTDHVATVAEALSGNELEIAPLAAHLQSVRQRQDEIAKLGGEKSPASHVATIQGDKNIEFRVLERVMYTLNVSGWDNISLAVLQKS